MKKLFRRLVASRLENQVAQLIADNHIKVVAVTGSVGKTSTKLAIAEVLRTKFKVLAHEGNYNSEIGLPLSIFELEVPSNLFNPLAWSKILATMRQKAKNYPYNVLVLEMGVDTPGEMDIYLRYITPDVGLVTAIQKVHIEQFKTIEAIAYEKLKLPKASHKAVLNNDDPILREAAKELGALTFGQSGEVHFENLDLQPDGIAGDLKLADGSVSVKTKVIAEHSLRALEAAAAVGLDLGLDSEQIKAGIENFRPFKGRMNPLPGIKNSTVIDDSYNSSPGAAVAAIEALMKLPGRHLAVLGSMNELGDYAEEGHRLVGEQCAGLDYLVTVGADAENYLVPAAIKAGLAAAKIRSFSSPFEAGRVMSAQVQAGDVVLCKGSQNRVFVEEAVKQLLADPSDQSQLVRQSKAWMTKKRAQFPSADKLPLLSPVKRITMQPLAKQIGEELAARSCAPVSFYMLLRSNGYISLQSPKKFIAELSHSDLHTGKNDWSRPALSSYLRKKYAASIVSWAWPYNDQPDLEKMMAAGYVATDREIDFYKRNIQGRDVAEIVREGKPVIVTMKPGFGAHNNSVHAVILLQWLNDTVVLADPDVRNTRTEFSAKIVREFIDPKGAGTVVLPKP